MLSIIDNILELARIENNQRHRWKWTWYGNREKLVDMMSGSIAVDSKLGEGTTFTVRIPCRIAQKEEAMPKRAEEHIDMENLCGKRILLAEDNELYAEIAMELQRRKS